MTARAAPTTGIRQAGSTSLQNGDGSWTGYAGKDDLDGSSARLKPGADNSSDIMPGSSLIGGTETIKAVNKGIGLYDELKLANRFKEEEIKYIISMLEKEIINIGSKYFITLGSSIEFKKINNVITFTVNLKQED